MFVFSPATPNACSSLCFKDIKVPSADDCLIGVLIISTGVLEPGTAEPAPTLNVLLEHVKTQMFVAAPLWRSWSEPVHQLLTACHTQADTDSSSALKVWRDTWKRRNRFVLLLNVLIEAAFKHCSCARTGRNPPPSHWVCFLFPLLSVSWMTPSPLPSPPPLPLAVR